MTRHDSAKRIHFSGGFAKTGLNTQFQLLRSSGLASRIRLLHTADPPVHLRRSHSMKARGLVIVSLALVLMALLTGSASAQSASSIVGAVKDTSGAVMPGVTVEAASPELIEKVKSAVTDERGLYQIVDLRPGVYTVTFTLPGFSTVKREALELAANFTATVNAEMRVGALEETITVSGASPV